MNAARTWARRVLAPLLLGAVIVWAVHHAFVAPSSVVTGPRPSPGLPNSCTLVGRALVEQLVPGAVAGERELARHRSDCTLAAGGRSLRIEIDRSPPRRGADGAAENLAGRRQARELFARRWQPPLQDHRGIGDEAFVERFLAGPAAAALLAVRQDDVVVAITYQAPPEPPSGRTKDPAAYAAVVSGAERVAADVLAKL